MADLQISNLPALAEAGIQATDVLALADLSATETKKVTVKDLVAAAAQFLDAGDIPAAKIGSGISAGSLADGSVTNVKLANDSVSFGGVSVDLGAADATPAFNLSDATAYPTSALVGTITNAQLAGSIANAKLANSSVSLGGITVALGASDATPAFDLTDATNYKTTNLVGTITNAQLAGSIDVSKLVGSNVNFGGVTVALGGSDTTPAFNLSDATNYPTSALVGTITNAQLAGSIANTKLVANSITANELAANSVTDSELANLSVATGSVQDGAITNDKVETSTSATTGLDGATKIRDATITPAKLNTSNLDRSINVASGNLGINNAVTAATRSGITYNAQGLITGTAALAAADLPVATTSAVGGVSVGTGLSVNGSGVLSLSNSVTGATVSGITFSNTGQITAATALVAGDLPVATTSAKGAVQITSGGGLTVDGSGNLTTSTSGISAGTYQSITVNNKGVATAGAALTAALIPDLAASKITSGTLDGARIANDSIDSTKLSNSSTAVIQSISQLGYPTAAFTGQLLFDPIAEDAYLWDGNAWNPITTLTKGALVRLGTYNANLSQVDYVTAAGSAAGLTVGQNLPVASESVDGGYVVISVQGTPSGIAGVTGQLSPPDYLLGVTASATSSSWVEIDLSTTVASQQASAISYTPHGQLSSTNVQLAINELENEKLSKAGGTVTGEVLIGVNGSLVFEGSGTDDAFETTLTVVSPTTSDKTITLPNVTGTVITTGDTGTVTSTMLANGTIVNADINASAAITLTKLENVTSAQIIVGNGSNVPTAVAVTGDIGINNAGLTSITAGAIVNADINASAAIAGSKITTGTTSAVGVLQLTDAADSTSTTTAATPAAVKTAKDAADAAATTANAALPKAGGTMTGNLILDNAKELRLSEGDSDGANYTGLKAQAQTGDITLTLPAVAPTAGQVLKANASTPTTLEWGTDSATDSTKMPLAGGTFTGDVTFTGDSSNVVWDKSASAFTGTITATAFSGPLTGDVTGTASGNAVLTGSTNNTITTVTGANAIQGEANLTFDGTSLVAETTIQVQGGSGDTLLNLHRTNAAGSNGNNFGAIKWTDNNSNEVASIRGERATAVDDANLTFFTRNTGGSATERMRIDSSGNVLLGSTSGEGKLFISGPTTDEGDAKGQIWLCDTAAYDASPVSGIVFKGIHTGTSQAAFSSVYGGKENSTDANYSGYLAFSTRTHGSTAAERMRIDSSGKVGIGTSNPNGDVHIVGDTNSNGPELYLQVNNNNTTDNIGALWFGNNVDKTLVKLAGHTHTANNTSDFTISTSSGGTLSEAMRIDSSGRTLIGTTTADGTYTKLSVAGTGSGGSPSIGNGTVAVFRSTGGAGYAAGISVIGGTTGSSNLYFGDTDSESRGRLEYSHTNDSMTIRTAETTALTLDSSQNATFAGTVSDSKGNLRNIPQNYQASNYTLVNSDGGKHILADGNITWIDGRHAAGDAVTIVNATSGNITITKGTTMYNTADGDNDDRTLASRGVATILWVSGTVAYISGAGLS